MKNDTKKIAINIGAGYTPGINSIIIGAALAAHNLGWKVVGIRDGFEGLLFPDRYPDGGLIDLGPGIIERLNPAGSDALGTSASIDPFHVRTVTELGMIEEEDMSDALLKNIQKEKIDAVISIVMGRGLSILYKLNQKGLNSVCIPRSVENDMAYTAVSFGFNTALSFTIDMLDRAREAAQSARKIFVVEVLGEHAGWLALQSGIAVMADAVVIPEIKCEIKKLAGHLIQKLTSNRPYGLVVVAEGAKFTVDMLSKATPASSLKKSLSPLATGDDDSHVIQRSGKASEIISNDLQQLIPHEVQPLVLNQWVRGGSATAVDRQIGLCYGAAAVSALQEGNDNTIVAFVPPEITFIPLADALNKVRTVPAHSEFMKVAQTLGIFTGA
jgi:6-phosphofructokinase